MTGVQTCALPIYSIKKSQTSQATGLQIQSVFPRIGTPAGSDKVRIRGKDFQSPTQLTQLISGDYHTCAIGSNGKAYCWGDDSNGQLGNNTIINAYTPVAVHQGQIPAGVSLTQIVAGWSHTCALGSDAKAYCWGRGNDGQLGNNTTADAYTPVAVHQGQIPTSVNLTQITAGYEHTCALGSDGKTYCWGRGTDGQLGNNTTTFALTPVAVHQGQIPSGSTQVKVDGVSVPVKYISPYELEITTPAHSAGKVNITVTNPDNTTHTLSQAYEYYQPQNPTITSITPNTSSVTGNTQLTVSGNHLDPMRWNSVHSGFRHTCALSSDAKAYCWGSSEYGQLGNNTTTDILTPVAIHQGEIPSGVTISQIATGTYSTCAIGSDAKAYCWGYNGNGQLGNNATANALTPVAVHQGQIPAGVSLTQIATGGYHTCALGSDAKAYCWGYGPFGQLGNNATTNALTPVAVHQGQIPAGVILTQITTGGYHTCALSSDAKAYCWGHGEYGRLGSNTATNTSIPVAVHQGQIPNDVVLTQVSAGQDHTCALGSNGKAYCWGSGSDGQLGNNTTTNTSTPVAVHQGQIPAGVSLTQITAGNDHTCALGSDAKAYCWGSGSDGT